jgi:hypothetical protein
MNATAVVIEAERLQLSLQIKRIPEEHSIEKLAAHDIFVDIEAEDAGDLLSDTHTTEFGIALFHINDGCDELRGGPLRPGFT